MAGRQCGEKVCEEGVLSIGKRLQHGLFRGFKVARVCLRFVGVLSRACHMYIYIYSKGIVVLSCS